MKNSFKLAAEALIQGFESPVKFLSFLTEATSMVHNYQFSFLDGNEPDESHYFLTLLSDQIALPWLQNQGDELNQVSTGIQELADTFSFQDIQGFMNTVLLAILYDFQGGHPAEGKIYDLVNSCNSILLMGKEMETLEASAVHS